LLKSGDGVGWWSGKILCLLPSNQLVKEKPSKILFSVAETDKSIHELVVNKQQIEKHLAEHAAELASLRENLQRLEVEYKEISSRQTLEETRLREEERRIVERRRQLSSLGGAKSARLMERELDIATRMIQTMEKSTIDAMEASERIQGEIKTLHEQLAQQEVEYENELGQSGRRLEEIAKELEKLEAKRDSLLSGLEDRLQNLFKRVSSRYPGEALARAAQGSCQSCYRALPVQTYNQILAGNLLIQCPGCSRILVHIDGE
jgi:predicted  nucleic acid-binding Zn-ribbon protein